MCSALIGDALPHRHVQLIKEITALGTTCLLHLGSHPDDEEGGLIAYLSRGHGVRTVYWSATRGEGGQNRSGPERGEALGVVRTWESLAAREIDGGEVRYGPFYDFGFSKSGADTLRRWGRARVVREMVRTIRDVQPLVLVCRWSGRPGDGHGHHQAIGLVVGEAFDAAGDPTQFPELRLPPWQPRKLYRSVAGDWQPGEDGSFGVIVEEYEQAGFLRIDTGRVDPAAGLTYQEQAHLAVNQHRSQGMAFVPEPGPYYYYYRPDRGRPSTARETSFFDGLDPTITGLAGYPGAAWPGLSARLATVHHRVQEAARAFRPDRPSTSVPALLEAHAALLSVLRDVDAQPLAPDAAAALTRHLSRTAGRIPAVVTACLHVRVECLLDVARTTPGRDVTTTVRVWNGGPLAVRVEQVRLQVPAGWQVTRVGDPDPLPPPAADVATEVGYVVTVSPDASPDVPYWLRDPRDPYHYHWPETDPSLGLPFGEPPVWAVVELSLDGHRWAVRTRAVHRAGFAGGSRELPLVVLPPLALAPRQRRELVPIAGCDTVLDLDVRVRCIEVGGARARLSVVAPDGWAVQPAPPNLHFAAGGDTHNARFKVTVPADADPGAYTVQYDLVSAGRACAVEVTPVRRAAPGSSAADEDDCVAETHLVLPATVAVDLVDATFVDTLRYGYVRGMDEQILPALARFDLAITEIGDDQLKYGDLSEFNAIIVGPNAYTVRPAVRHNAGRLLDYVREGGALLVQHQGYGYGGDGLTPYPLGHRQPHDRVTDPGAPVQVLDPEHPILHFPNEIGPADFAGWVHDRGMYFMGEWDRRYSAVLASGDVGEQPCGGGLLTTTYGRGTYVYAAYSFFRQIPAGVPGAVRLFANLLGLAEVRVRERMARLAAVELFRFMTESQLYEAARIVSERWVGAGSYLAREGERGHELFVVIDGMIDVVKHVAGDGDRLLHVARPGEALGELALLADISRTASLRAATDSVVLVVRDEAFYEWLRRHPDLSWQIMQRLAEQLAAKNAER